MTTKVKGSQGIEFPDATQQATAAGIAVTSNSLGSCMKYPDGTMIFYGKVSFTPAPWQGSAGQWFSEVTGVFTFPTPFIAVPSLQMGVLDQNISARSAYCSYANANTTAVSSAFLFSPVQGAPGVEPIILTCIAFGRWKS